MLRRIATTEELAVSLPRARQRLRIDAIESDSDNDLTALIQAATLALESRAAIAVTPTTFDLMLSGWGCNPLDIPMAPVRDVDGVFYTDTDGDEQEVSAGDWTWTRTTEGAQVRFVRTWSSPGLDSVSWPVRLRFTAGFDVPGEASSPPDPELAQDKRIEMAILFLVAHWNERREAGAEVDVMQVPMTFEFLADQLRVYR